MRSLTQADVPRLREIDALCFSENDRYSDDFYAECLSQERFERYGALDASETIVGWVLLDASPEPVRIRSLSVHPDARRQGIATALVRAVLAGRKCVDLLVDNENAAALALYRKLGFEAGAPDAGMPQRVRLQYAGNA